MNRKQFDPKYQGNAKIVIYGTTTGGKVIFQCLQSCGIATDFFCDRSGKYSEFCGIPVIKPDILSAHPEYMVLNALTRSFDSACQYLEKIGYKEIYLCQKLIENKTIVDFSYDKNEKEHVVDFLQQYPIYASAANNIILPTLEVFITERCTLRCRDCSHLIPRYQQAKDHNIDEIINTLENILKVVDNILDLIILGGEPLLHKHLDQLLDWAHNQKQISTITIITNGSVVPDNHLWSALERSKSRIRISNYGKYSTKLAEISDICLQRGITYFINNELWTDMGAIYNHNYTEKELKEIFMDCPFSYSVLLLNKKLFRCAHVAHLNNLHVIDSVSHDCVDFSNFSDSNIETLKESLKSYMKIDFLKGCQYCNGIKNSVSGIEPAIQGKR